MIDLFFILLNFAIVIGIGYYGARRYFIPQLQEKVDQEKATNAQLHDEHRNLLLAHKQLDESLVLQEADCTSFLNKINEWRSVVNEAKVKKKKEQHYFREEAEKRVHLQSRYHMLKSVYKHVTPLVIKTLERDLQSHFSDEKVAHSYMQRVLKNLKK